MTEVPLVLKTPVSMVVVGNTGQEPYALRHCMEWFGFRVETHWTGSRKELVEILKGNIPTHSYIVISCHGEDDDGGRILVPDESPLAAAEIEEIAILPGKTVLNLGCALGTESMARAFLNRGCKAYIAATGYVDGSSALMFAIHYFYFLYFDKSLAEAVALSREHDDQCRLFRLFQVNPDAR
jgi:hypothetical protein